MITWMCAGADGGHRGAWRRPHAKLQGRQRQGAAAAARPAMHVRLVAHAAALASSRSWLHHPQLTDPARLAWQAPAHAVPHLAASPRIQIPVVKNARVLQHRSFLDAVEGRILRCKQTQSTPQRAQASGRG